MNSRKEIFLISGGFGVLCVAVLFVTFWYFLPALEQSSENFAQAELGLQLTNNDQSARIKSTYEKMQQSVQEATNLFANPTTPLNLIGFWEKVTGEESLIMKISPVVMEKYKYDPWKFLGFEVTLSGKFINIQKFVEKIENSKYIFEISNLIIKKNPVSENNKTDEATAIILLKAYTN